MFCDGLRPPAASQLVFCWTSLWKLQTKAAQRGRTLQPAGVAPGVGRAGTSGAGGAALGDAVRSSSSETLPSDLLVMQQISHDHTIQLCCIEIVVEKEPKRF